jgi:hypothetical protein
MKFTIEPEFFTDPRVMLFSDMMNTNLYEAWGRIIYVWHICYTRKTDVITRAGIDRGFKNFSKYLIESELANEVDSDTIRVRGISKRIGKRIRVVKKNVDVTGFLEVWNENCGNLPKVVKLSQLRKSKIQSRLTEEPDLEYWTTIVKKMAANPFLTGGNARGWKASFDFLLRPDTHTKIDEGAYGDTAETTTVLGTDQWRKQVFGNEPN